MNQSQPVGRWIGLLSLVLGLLAFGAPFLPGKAAFILLGLVILLMGIVQNATGFAVQRSSLAGLAFARGSASIVTGLLLLAMPKLTFTGLALLLGLSWLASGASVIVAALRKIGQADWHWQLLDGLANVLLGAAIAWQWPLSGILSIGVFLGLRYISEGWSALLGVQKLPDVDHAYSFPGNIPSDLLSNPFVEKMRAQAAAEETIRLRSDRGWRWLFLFIFFVIHASRMDAEWNFVGMLSPFGAVVGDAMLAVVLGYSLVAPVSILWRRMTGGLERRAWRRYVGKLDAGKATGLRSSITGWWLSRRLCSATRTFQTQGSATAALGWGLQAGLPLAALLIAVTPLWGVSWVFNTETWVTGGWEMWAEQRTDDWRVAMVDAVKQEFGDEAKSPEFFRVTPDGVPASGDFSFIVIGDTGEGDASQHVLRDQFLFLGQKPEMKFLLISSDVIYPSGSMRDYEPKFYLPFKGFQKPIYAIPGNHDWYDALEAFNANLLDPRAAKAALLGRREADHRLTTTTEARIDEMIAQAARLRKEYQINSGLQKAPYFEMHNDDFSLIVVDTGILRRVDDEQLRWLEGALTRSKDRFRMVLLGHPLYAAGHYQGDADESFAGVHELLKKHDVQVVMAGDTHDFEFYQEEYERDGAKRKMLHFVNGGGGAYLSIGTALSWPRKTPVADCGHYPRADQLTSALNTRTPAWKLPIWYWVRDLHAWPSSPEAVAAAFDYDHAPFFQSFVEVRVEPTSNRVRFLLHGVNGQLRWRDLHVQGPRGDKQDDFVEFALPLQRK